MKSKIKNQKSKMRSDPQSAIRNPQSDALRILILEDVPTDAELVERALRNAGIAFTSRLVDTRDDFLKQLEDFSPDLVLSDYSMPQFTGMEALELVKERYPSIPLIIVTGSMNEETAVGCMKAGAADYMLKDNLTRLGQAVNGAMEKKRLREEKERAEEALVKERDFIAHIMETSPVCIIVANRQGKITFVNPGAEEVLGLSRDDIAQRTYNAPEWHITDYNGRPFPEEQLPFRRVVDTGLPVYDVRYAIESPDEKRVLLSVNGAPLFDRSEHVDGVVLTIEDVTQQVQTASALQESEERFRALTESTSDWIWEVDVNGVYTYAGPKIKDLLGYEVEEVIGKTLFDFMPADEAERVGGLFRNIVDSREPFKGLENTNLHKNGRHVILETSGVPILDANGNLNGYRGIDRDITERKQAEEEKKKLEAQLQHAQRMEAIGTLAGGIAHDFNNILSLILGYTELSINDVPEGSRARDNLDKLYKAGERARDLVKQILTFSRQREQEQKPVEIHLIVKEVLKLLQSSLPRTIEIRQNIAITGTVLADPTQIHQVIMNLCTNAYHAMLDKGGVLEVSVEEVELDTEFTARHLGTDPGPHLRLTVTDTGYGMDKQVLDRIFEPYYTTRKESGGTGIGLSVVHGIVKNHGGVITVYSEPGKGTTFNVFLPRIESPEGVAETEEVGALPRGNERILFVDDEPAIVDIGKGMLGHLGYRVETRTSSIEALEAFRAQPEKFDLVITDMTMPNMTGDELARELMVIRSDLPIIICTGFSGKISEEKAKAMGIRKLVMKPIVMSEMAKAVREALDK